MLTMQAVTSPIIKCFRQGGSDANPSLEFGLARMKGTFLQKFYNSLPREPASAYSAPSLLKGLPTIDTVLLPRPLADTVEFEWYSSKGDPLCKRWVLVNLLKLSIYLLSAALIRICAAYSVEVRVVVQGIQSVNQVISWPKPLVSLPSCYESAICSKRYTISRAMFQRLYWERFFLRGFIW